MDGKWLFCISVGDSEQSVTGGNTKRYDKRRIRIRGIIFNKFDLIVVQQECLCATYVQAYRSLFECY